MAVLAIEKIPQNVFLDTTVVNFILEYGEQIHENVEIPKIVSQRVGRDIEALREIWLTGQRANWRITISDSVLKEIGQTRDSIKRNSLKGWASELWSYSNENALVSKHHSRFVNQSEMEKLSIFPGSSDRRLIQDALAEGCDSFCTRDWKTILRFREALKNFPMIFISPSEWWERIHPWAALWA